MNGLYQVSGMGVVSNTRPMARPTIYHYAWWMMSRSGIPISTKLNHYVMNYIMFVSTCSGLNLIGTIHIRFLPVYMLSPQLYWYLLVSLHMQIKQFIRNIGEGYVRFIGRQCVSVCFLCLLISLTIWYVDIATSMI